MLIKKNDITKYLPHRSPFLFIDSVEDVKPLEKKASYEIQDLIGSQVTAHYHTDKDHPIFKGHFPNNPILPGVVQLEMMAQAGAFTFVSAIPDMAEKEFIMAFMSADEVKFRKPVLPGMNLTIQATCSKIKSSIVSHKSKIFHQGELMSQGTTLCLFKSKT